MMMMIIIIIIIIIIIGSSKALILVHQSTRHRRLSTCVTSGILTFQSVSVTLRTTRFKIKKFYVVPTLRLCVLYGSQNKQQLLPYKTLTGFYNRSGECLQRGTH
jgi:hypothetical protein